MAFLVKGLKQRRVWQTVVVNISCGGYKACWVRIKPVWWRFKLRDKRTCFSVCQQRFFFFCSGMESFNVLHNGWNFHTYFHKMKNKDRCQLWYATSCLLSIGRCILSDLFAPFTRIIIPFVNQGEVSWKVFFSKIHMLVFLAACL